MSQRARALVWGLTLLALALVVATAVFALLDVGSATGQSGSGSNVLLDLLFLVLPVSFSAVGALLATRRPENGVGWLCLTIGVLWSIEGFGYGTATWAGRAGMSGTAAWVGLLGSLWLPAVGLTGTHLALRLPGGALLSARWRGYSRFCTAVIVLIGVLVVTEPGRVADVPGTHNPIASEWLQSLSPLFILLPLSVLGAISSLVVRYRRAGGTERLQIRGIAFGGSAVLAAALTSFSPTLLGLASEGSAPRWVEGFIYVAFAAIPVAIGIAVLRYRLYDIDVVINRALVYGALTATLAAAYLGSVLLLQLLLSGVTADNGLAVAGSTLAAAALFQPARRRIQTTVDRRFFRRKYDAVRTLEAFGARLRDELDLDSLQGELRAVVADTMQPEHVSLWLREAPR